VLAACVTTKPKPCPNCFAVFVMPDTQYYTQLGGQPEHGSHFELITRYICQHRTAWMEPSTGKRMPILMLIHLGDIVNLGDRDEGEKGGGPLAQWVRVDKAFDHLDNCSPKVPYLVTVGNHDLDGFNYEGATQGYNEYFGADRWTSQGYGCASPDECAWDEGRWFIGGGDPIAAGSRNRVGEGEPGPSVTQPGRHRSGLIEAPNGQKFLFMGLDIALDYPPPANVGEGDDLAWPNKIFDLYPRTPTIVFHHSMFWSYKRPDSRLRWGPELWHSDSLEASHRSTGRGMKALYDVLLEPRDQVRFIFSGHVVAPAHQADYTIPRSGAPPVWGFLRNYQNTRFGGKVYGAGWNVIAVFDPDAGQVRVRSYRIDDEAAYAKPPVNQLHVGKPVPTECMQMDQHRFRERVIQWDFRVADAPG
jgi:hypothetical protein